jgi:hypothetical protein
VVYDDTTGMPVMDVKVHMMSIPIDMNGNIVPNGSMQGQGPGQRPNNNNNNNNESGNKVRELFPFFYSIVMMHLIALYFLSSFLSSIPQIVPLCILCMSL